MRIKTCKLLFASFTTTLAVGGCGYVFYRRKKFFNKSTLSQRKGIFDLANVNGYEFVKKLNEFDLANDAKSLQAISALDTAGWCALALEDHALFRFFQPKFNWSSTSKDDVSKLLSELNLDSQWLSALNWYLANICTDEDLYCQETSPLTRESKNERLVKLLRVLLFKSEFGECENLVEKDIIRVLYHVLENFRDSRNLQISIIALKILSNIALKSRKGARKICESPLLDSLHTMLHQPLYEEESILAHKICINALHALGVGGAYRLLGGVYELHRPPLDTAPTLDVVFVHGLRGTVFRTWRQRDDLRTTTTKFWPRWLPNDVSQPIRILALDYPSRLLSLGSVMESIPMRSEKFQRELAAAGVGERPLIFICHSMGGLLVKHLLINNEMFLRHTIGVLFMSTPHRGSPLAGYRIPRPSDDLRMLRVDNEINQQLDMDFKRLAAERIPHFVSILELRETPIFGVHHFIVPHESGVFGRGAVYHVDAHHHHVCKPTSRDDNSYAIVLNFLREALRSISKNVIC